MKEKNLYNRELIEDHMKLSKEERQSHIDLSAPCIEIGDQGHMMRGVLSLFLLTTLPKGHKIVLCHACGNGKCSNPHHLYWGTSSENEADKKIHGTFSTGWQKTVEKYGEEKARQIIGRAGQKGGKALKGIPKSAEHKAKLSAAAKNQYM